MALRKKKAAKGRAKQNKAPVVKAAEVELAATGIEILDVESNQFKTANDPVALSTANSGQCVTTGEPTTILSLPYEMLDMIILDPDLTPKDRFHFKIASCRFYDLRPDWDTLKSEVSLAHRHDTICRFHRMLPNSYECSVCKKRHRSEGFERSEFSKPNSERKCFAYTGAIPLFEDVCLPFDCLSQALRGVPPGNLAPFPFYWVMHRQRQSSGPTKTLIVQQEVTREVQVVAASDISGLENSIKFSLGRGWHHVYLQTVVEIYIPWMSFLVAQCEYTNGIGHYRSQPLQLAWTKCIRPWSFPICDHQNLSDEKFCSSVAGAIQRQSTRPLTEASRSSTYTGSFRCAQSWCLCTCTFRLSGDSASMVVEIHKDLGTGLYASDNHWKAYVRKDRYQAPGLGENWKTKGETEFSPR